MFLKKANYKNGRTYLSIVEGYRDGGKVKQRTVKKIGYLDELINDFEDPVKHFTEVVAQMNRESEEDSSLNITVDFSRVLDYQNNSYNVGYLPLKYIYNECGLDQFCINLQKSMDIHYSLNKNLELQVLSRILLPASKKSMFESRNFFFAPFNNGITKDSVYDCLDVFDKYKDKIQKLLWDRTRDIYNRDCSRSYYDCTNYYFEIEYNDEDTFDENGNISQCGLRKRGPEKNKRPDPIVEMGLLMDSTGIPMAFDIFPGNESEKLSLRPVIKKTKANFGIERTVVVADRGLNTSDNIFYLAGFNNDEDSKKDGYVYGQSVRGADKEFKKWVLDESGYKIDTVNENGEDIRFVHKSRVFAKTLKIKKDGKRSIKVNVCQKQMVYFSFKYLMKQRNDRNKMIIKAKEMIGNPAGYTKATTYGAAAYVSNLEFDQKTGEIRTDRELVLNEEKIREEEKYDGYYSIVTSETELSDHEIRKIYRGLAKIEDTFKISKSNLNARPAFVWTPAHIRGHFLTCFIALVIMRLLEKKLEYKYSVDKIIESMKRYCCINIDRNIYQFIYRDEIIDDISNHFNVNLEKKYRKKGEIKKILKY